MTSTGYPAAYENVLTADGVSASKAAAAAAAVAQAGVASPTAAAAVGVGVASAAPTPTPTPAAGGGSAFAQEAGAPRLPLLGGAGVSAMGAAICPGVPSTAALGVKGGLTKVVPAEIYLPQQHSALFSHETQRALIHSSRSSLQAALATRVMARLQPWQDTFEEAKNMLPHVERLRVAAAAARTRLDKAKGAVVAAEASNPLVSVAELQDSGQAVPRVLVRGSEGTVLLPDGTATASAAVGGAGCAGGGMVAVPAAAERAGMYEADQADTDATLSFELAEKVLHDRLRWLMEAGAGLKALTTAALAHSLSAAAAMGQPGEAASGSAGGGMQRAPIEELLQPFPQHVVAHLKGEHLPTLQQLVLADLDRLARWGERYRAAMAAEASATAAAAGAQMLAAAAHAPAGPADAQPPAVVPQVPLFRTDEATAGGAAAGKATALSPGGTGGSQDDAAASKAAPAGGSGQGFAGGMSGVERGLRQAAAKSGLPLDLLAAAVAAGVHDAEASAAVGAKSDIAWRLLHDASVVVSKQQAVLLPALKAAGSTAPDQLAASHVRITDALARLQQADPAAADFDVIVLDVLEFLTLQQQELQSELLPALAEQEAGHSQRALASAYRTAAASAPTRPHRWLLSSGGGASAGADSSRAAQWAAAARGAAGRLVQAPVKAGARLADAAADAAHFGLSGVPAKA